MAESDAVLLAKLKNLWNGEFLPSIRKEIKAEIHPLAAAVKSLTERCAAIEQSEAFLSDKYDQHLQVIQQLNSKFRN